MRCGDIETQPGPRPPNNFKLAYWKMGGLPTDNFSKKTNLEAFLSNNKLDIVMIGETHLKICKLVALHFRDVITQEMYPGVEAVSITEVIFHSL